ncbi:MAG TPA: DUF481 domain-containing protein [Vicinamibacterales bacterium]|nr:DUF481 domain-containing protein [Vicinamibacterales bacterium]
MARPGTIIGAIMLVVLASTPALAQPKTDVITLVNGDRITGEIVRLSRGRLELKTDDAGTIYIEWDNVARLQATRQFEVETTTRQRLYGALATPSDRRLQIGAIPTLLPLDEITQIAPINAGFWAKLEGAVDAGFSYTRSSGVAQVNLSGDVRYRRPEFLIHLNGSATVTDQNNGDQTDDRAAVELAYARYRGPNWFIAGATRFESNESLGLKLRSQLGGLLGRRLISTNRAQMQAGAGLVGNDEQGVDTEATQNIEGLLSFTTSFYSYDGSKTNLDFAFQYYPSLSNWGRQRVQLDTSFKRDLYKDLNSSLNLFFTFDSKPPNPSAARSDLGITLSFGWSF